MEGMTKDEDLFSPAVNIRLGAKHMSGLLKKYNGEKIYAIAAYNAGAKAVDRWLARYPHVKPEVWMELISYNETRQYVKKVLSAQRQYKSSAVH